MQQVHRSMYSSLTALTLALSYLTRLSAAVTVLPPQLLAVIPECANNCVQILVADDFSSSCPDTKSLDCLCRARTDNGFTLGEGALACIYVQCPDRDYQETKNETYWVCQNEDDSAAPYHTAIAAPAALPSQISYRVWAATTSSTTSSTAAPTSSAMSTSRVASSLSTLTTLALSSTTTPLTSSSSSTYTIVSPASSSLFTGPSVGIMPSAAAAVTPSDSPTPTPVLGKGQIAGIAVGGTVAASTAVGLLVFIFCGRKLRKNNRRRDSDVSFGANHPSGSEMSQPEVLEEPPKAATPLLPPPPRSTQRGPKQNQFLGLPVAPNQHRQSWWNSRFGGTASPQMQTPSQVGVAKHLTPGAGGVSQDTSPSSLQSYHTTSELLPEKPAYAPNAHEKKASNDTSLSQPIVLGGNVGFRVTAPTPEPAEPSHYVAYGRPAWPPRQDSRHTLEREPSMEGSALKGKLSDPFLNKPHDQINPSHPSTAMFQPKRASRSGLPKINTISPPRQAAARTGQQHPQGTGVPNFRALIQPRHRAPAPVAQRTPPPQLPTVTPFSPISPEIQTPGTVNGMKSTNDRSYHPAQTQSIMSRGRPAPNPFFSSQQSQAVLGRPYKSRSRRTRPETHYTTGSETSFEDDEPSPLSPPELQPHVGIAELPGLSPVAESPSSRATREQMSTRTPSPRVRGSPPFTEERKTPLSRLRYPEIPGKAESPRCEFGTVPLAIESPRHQSPGHVAELPSPSDGSTNSSHHRRQRSTGTILNSPAEPESKVPSRQRSDSSPGLLTVPRKQKLVPSPLRPGRASGNFRQSGSEVAPPPPPPKDQPVKTQPSPPTAASTRKFHEAARRLGSIDASNNNGGGLGNWPVQPTRPVELPARNSGGLGNWPMQPTRPVRPVAAPRPQLDRNDSDSAQRPALEDTFASSSVRIVDPSLTRRSIAPGVSHASMHVPAVHDTLNGASQRGLVRPSTEAQAHMHAWQMREDARRQEFERQQAELAYAQGGFVPGLDGGPLPAWQPGPQIPTYPARQYGSYQNQPPRRELLGYNY